METAVAQTVELEFLVCSACLSEYSSEDGVYFDDQDLCPECAEELTGVCNNCGERVWNDNIAGDSTITLCQRCYDNHYTGCEGCGAIIHFNSAYRTDDDEYDYCWDCYTTHQKKRRAIHDYSFKPDPIFYPACCPNDLFLGIELELDNGGEDSGNAEELLQIANRFDERVYIKHDGSLNDGFEVVSHPCTLDYHTKHFPWAVICRKAVEMGYSSHNSGTCGLHVHVSRSAFGDTYDAQESVIARILFFVESHFNEMLRFSRRTESQLNKWASRYGLKENPKSVLEHAKNSCLGRYAAINIQPYDTIEFRIYRGSLKYQTFIAALQITHEICRAAIHLSDAEFRAMSWSEFVLSLDKERYPELIEYLKLRRLYVNEEIVGEEEI
jgi:hypothetical protein